MRKLGRFVCAKNRVMLTGRIVEILDNIVIIDAILRFDKGEGRTVALTILTSKYQFASSSKSRS